MPMRWLLEVEARPPCGPADCEGGAFIVRQDSAASKVACAACRRRLMVGEIVTLVAIGPGDDVEHRRRAQAGESYHAVALPAHWSCVTGEPVERFDATRLSRRMKG